MTIITRLYIYKTLHEPSTLTTIREQHSYFTYFRSLHARQECKGEAPTDMHAIRYTGDAILRAPLSMVT